MIRKLIVIALAGLLSMALGGCGSSNSDAPAYLGTHPLGWSAGTYHGVQALTPAKREQCAECHGKDLRGGISKVSCYSCHGTYPHPEGWAEGTQHGPQYTAHPQECQKCHGQDLQGGISGVSCSACHPGYPHSATWAQPLQHGYGYGANPQSCQQCHGADLNGGTSTVSCIAGQTGCHVSPIHNHVVWDTNHGKSAKLAPSPTGTFESFFTCRNCHGADFAGTPVSGGKSCLNTSCHKMVGYPDVPPHSGSWNDPYNFIGATHTTTDRANAPVCYQCHNRDQGPHVWLDATAKPTNSIPNMLTPSTGNPDPNAAPDCFNNTLCHGPKP